MGAYQAKAVALRESGNIGTAPDQPFTIVGPFKDFIDQEEDRCPGSIRRLVEQDYTWDRQAERLAAVYRWLSGGGPPPEAVVP